MEVEGATTMFGGIDKLVKIRRDDIKKIETI